MFGIKIISTSRYNELLEIVSQAKSNEPTETELDTLVKLESDCESLRQQNGELREKYNKLIEDNNGLKREVKSLIQFKRDTLEAMGKIDIAGFRLSVCKHKCKHCKHEQPECCKYTFGNHEFCIIPISKEQ
jgi:hypothetical protein